MDCIRAQAVVSEVLDGHPVDSDSLEAAKAHCRECEECGLYVRALNTIRRATPPQPPADLADRIMAAIRLEANSASHAVERSDGAADAGAAPAPFAGEGRPEAGAAGLSAAVTGREAGPGGVPSESDVIELLGDSAGARRVSFGGRPLDRRQVIAWGSAAAVLLIVAGVTTALGILNLVSGGAGSRSASPETVTMAAPESAKNYTAGAGGSPTQDLAAKTATSASTSATNLYVLFGGFVYSRQDGEPPSSDKLTVAGQARLAFDLSRPPMSREVLKTAGSTDIYLADDSQVLQRFAPVTRVYRGKSYQLQSADISEYGAWPTLPSGVPRPVPEDNPDGAPVFALDGQDASGTPVYHRVGTDTRAGIAVGPGTPAGDPAAGNPNWTWWAPQ